MPPSPSPTDYANPELLEKIPLTAKTVLDVGCRRGALGAAYLRRNPRATVLGIELNPEDAEAARARLSEVFCGDVEQTPMPFAPEGGIDCIIYGDVLEHLVDPWAVLAAHARHLNPGGTVLVCMPNAEHWSMVARLLTGRFDYSDDGLMDRGHLRWFTPRMMGEALTKAGLELADLAPRPVPNADKAQQFVEAISPALHHLGIDPRDYLDRAGPLQFIWRARKAGPARLEIAATMLNPQSGVSDVRVVEPLRALRTDSAVFGGIGPEADIAPTFPGAARIAVLHRPLLLGDSGLARLRALIDKGYLVISEFDDHPSFLEQRGVDVSELMTFKAVHAIQTSTRPLAEALLAHNPEVAVFPNAIFELPQPANFTTPDRLTLLFAAINRQDDWAPYIGVINEVARAVGGRLRINVLHDQPFFEALDTPHKQFLPLTDYATYLRVLQDAEISFMPLEDNLFNRAKSDLKFIEAGAARVCALASPTVYDQSIRDGKTGMMFRDATELRANLLKMLAYPEVTRQLADNARAYVAENRMLAYQTEARLTWYRSLWARRDELTAALKVRAPELFG